MRSSSTKSTKNVECEGKSSALHRLKVFLRNIDNPSTMTAMDMECRYAEFMMGSRLQTMQIKNEAQRK